MFDYVSFCTIRKLMRISILQSCQPAYSILRFSILPNPGKASKFEVFWTLDDWDEEKDDFWTEVKVDWDDWDDINDADWDWDFWDSAETNWELIADDFFEYKFCELVTCCPAEDHSPARGGVWDLTSISAFQLRVEVGRLPLGESAKVTLRPLLLPLGTGLPLLESRSMDISLCKKPSFFLLTKPVFTLPHPRPDTSSDLLATWPEMTLDSEKIKILLFY